MKYTIILAVILLSACAGGTREAQLMSISILCKTILELSPVYMRYDEYLIEAQRRGADCGDFILKR